MTYTEWVRHRSCERKHGWTTEALATNYCTLASWSHPEAPVMHAYRCDFCDGWHVTSQALRLDVEIPKDVVA